MTFGSDTGITEIVVLFLVCGVWEEVLPSVPLP